MHIMCRRPCPSSLVPWTKFATNTVALLLAILMFFFTAMVCQISTCKTVRAYVLSEEGTSDFAAFTVRAPHALHTLHTWASVHVTRRMFWVSSPAGRLGEPCKVGWGLRENPIVLAQILHFAHWQHMKSGQIIATSHDLTRLVREIPLFQGNLGWWNIIIWPDEMIFIFVEIGVSPLRRSHISPRRHPWSSMGRWRKREIGRHLSAGWGRQFGNFCGSCWFSQFPKGETGIFCTKIQKWNATCMTVWEKQSWKGIPWADLCIYYEFNARLVTTVVEKTRGSHEWCPPRNISALCGDKRRVICGCFQK